MLFLKVKEHLFAEINTKYEHCQISSNFMSEIRLIEVDYKESFRKIYISSMILSGDVIYKIFSLYLFLNHYLCFKNSFQVIIFNSVHLFSVGLQ
jgi:hypothetical protein